MITGAEVIDQQIGLSVQDDRIARNLMRDMPIREDPVVPLDGYMKIAAVMAIMVMMLARSVKARSAKEGKIIEIEEIERVVVIVVMLPMIMVSTHNIPPAPGRYKTLHVSLT